MYRTLFNKITGQIEYILTIVLFIGIITFNKTFAYIGIRSIYISEFIIVLCLISLAIKLLLKKDSLTIFTRETIQHLLYRFWPIIVIFVFAVIRLFTDLDYGTQAIRHSMIFLYSVLFMLLFVLSVNGNKQFFFIAIYLLIVLSSLFNGTKIIAYKLLDYSFNYYEQERVYHIETDTICASISILGLLVFRKYFWNKSKVGYIILLFLNLAILVLTVKRSAVFAIVPSLIIYFYLVRKELNIRKLLYIAGILIVAALLLLFAWYIADRASFNDRIGYIINKLSLHEKNTTWRIEAWKLAWQKFKEAPWLGIGYGPKIIELPVDNVNTNDPHNSWLAFLVRHGILIFSIYMFFIARTFKLIINEIKSSPTGSQQRNNAIFTCLGLASMLIFAFFNVVFENQYEGIFFYFFLSAIYIIKKKESSAELYQSIHVKYVSIPVIVLFVGFTVFAFSPYNQINKMPIYSADTNYSLPSKMGCEQGHLTYISKKNEGITIQKSGGDSTSSPPELLWFFPPQANKLNLKNYRLALQSNVSMAKLLYSVEYDDMTRIPLKNTSNNTAQTFELDTLSWFQNKIAKPKFLIVSFPNALEYKNLNIKNIYLYRYK